LRKAQTWCGSFHEVQGPSATAVLHPTEIQSWRSHSRTTAKGRGRSTDRDLPTPSPLLRRLRQPAVVLARVVRRPQGGNHGCVFSLGRQCSCSWRRLKVCDESRSSCGRDARELGSGAFDAPSAPRAEARVSMTRVAIAATMRIFRSMTRPPEINCCWRPY
jgi:hypothetical protein